MKSHLVEMLNKAIIIISIIIIINYYYLKFKIEMQQFFSNLSLKLKIKLSIIFTSTLLTDATQYVTSRIYASSYFTVTI